MSSHVIRYNILSLLKAVTVIFSVVYYTKVYAGEIKIGAMPVPASEVLEFAKPILEKRGVRIKIHNFSDFIMPNIALNDKQLDCNLYQHKPFLDKMSKDRNLDLVSIAPIYVVPLGLYSKRYKTIHNIPQKAIIALPNDPTNYSRALILLHDNGIITLKDSTNIHANEYDIKKNPKKLRFKPVEAPMLSRALHDVDAAVINGNFAVQAGLSIKDSLIHENGKSAYANIFVARRDNANNPDILTIKEILLSREVSDYIVAKYKGEIIPISIHH